MDAVLTDVWVGRILGAQPLGETERTYFLWWLIERYASEDELARLRAEIETDLTHATARFDRAVDDAMNRWLYAHPEARAALGSEFRFGTRA